MKIDQLLQRCVFFEKLAQQASQKIVLDPKKKNIDFWSKFLLHALQSYAQMLPSPQMAYQIFKSVAQYHSTLQHDEEFKKLQQIETSINEATQKLQQAGIDPIAALTQAGVSNLNANSLNVVLGNLKVLEEAKDFSKYQHYYLPAHGQAKEVIELDRDEGPGY